MEQGIGEPGEFHPAKSRIEVVGREHQPVQGHDAGQAEQYIAGIRLTRAHGIIGVGISDQESAQYKEKGNTGMKFIEQPQDLRVKLIPPVLTVVMQKDQAGCQASESGQGVKTVQ